jgi:hypothetical protein
MTLITDSYICNVGTVLNRSSDLIEKHYTATQIPRIMAFIYLKYAFTKDHRGKVSVKCISNLQDLYIQTAFQF